MNRLTRLFPIAGVLFGAAFTFACSDQPTAPSTPAFAVTRPRTLTRCQQQPYAATSAWIGPKGGWLKAGGHGLYVPPGALDQLRLLTMEVPSDNIGHVVFGPEGLIFNSASPAHLIMSYQNCWVTPDAVQQVAYASESLKILETQPSVNDPLTMTVDAKLTHFSDYVLLSTYAVAY